jgi:putative aldouronate transport system substrate-binding protein
LKRKPIACLLAIFLLAMALAACSSPAPAPEAPTAAPATAGPATDAPDESAPAEEVDPYEAERTPATFTMLNMSSATSTIDPWKDTPTGKLLAERTNVTLDIEYLVGADQRQKASLLIAAGAYPDFINGGDTAGDFYAAGSYIDVLPYMTSGNYPNLELAYPEWKQRISLQPDGGMYWFGAQPSENAVYPAAGYWLNMEVLAENDYPVVSGWEEWQTMILDYVAAHPTFNDQPTIGITEATEAWRASGVQYGAARYSGGYPNDGLTFVNQETLEAKIVMDQQIQYNWLKMLNRMWNAGVADKEMFMQTDDQFQQKVSSGRLAGLYEQRGFMQTGLDALNQTAPERMLVAFPVVQEGVETEMYRGYRNFTAGGGIGITVSCKDPDRAMRFFDDLAKEENQITMRYGIEGVDFSYNADGKIEKTTEQWKNFINVDYKRSQALEQMTWFHFYPGLEPLPTSGSIASPTNDPSYAQVVYNDNELEFLSHYKDRGYDSFISWFNPSKDGWYMGGATVRQRIATDDPRKVAGETALTITIESMPKIVTQCPTEAEFEAAWAEFTAKLAALPLREYEELATQMIKDSVELYKR